MNTTGRLWLACVFVAAGIAASQGCTALLETATPISPLKMERGEHGVRPLEAKSQGDHWLIRGEWIGASPRPVYWRADFNRSTIEQLGSEAEWKACASPATRFEQLRRPVREGLVQAKSQRVWLEEDRTKRVVAESPVRMKWIASCGADRARRWVIVDGTSVERHEFVGKPSIPLPGPTTHTFGPPKIVSLEAFSIPDLKPLGPEVLLGDATTILPDVRTASGFGGCAVWTADNMPGVLVFGNKQHIWAVGERALKGEKP